MPTDSVQAPLQPKEFLFYYAAALLLGLIVLFGRRGPRRGMRLKLRGLGKPKDTTVTVTRTEPANLSYTHINPDGERPLNVVFNYNGHSWDAYEVLGLPAGSSMENVEAAYKESLARVDNGSKAFVEAAFKAIQEQWQKYRKASAG